MKAVADDPKVTEQHLPYHTSALLWLLCATYCSESEIRIYAFTLLLQTEKVMREHNRSFSHKHGELQQLIDRAQQLVDATADKLDESIQSARGSLLIGLEDARSQAAELEESVRTKAYQAEDYVREKPYQAVGAAFVVGLFVGWLMSK